MNVYIYRKHTYTKIYFCICMYIKKLVHTDSSILIQHHRVILAFPFLNL